MNPYTILSSGLGTPEAAALSARLSAWHDAMVSHERRLRIGSDPCDDECPHAEARALWSEATATFGARAQELVFLRSRAQDRHRAAGSTAGTSDIASRGRSRGASSRGNTGVAPPATPALVPGA